MITLSPAIATEGYSLLSTWWQQQQGGNEGFVGRFGSKVRGGVARPTPPPSLPALTSGSYVSPWPPRCAGSSVSFLGDLSKWKAEELNSKRYGYFLSYADK